MAQPTSPKIEELRFRLKTDPKNRVFYLLAEELRRIGQFAEAEQVLRNGLTHHPTYLSAWVSLGRVLREQKNDRGAVEALSKALQLDPGNVVAARLLADAWLGLGEKVEAIKKYKLVQALLPPDEQLSEVIERLEREIKSEAEPPAPAAAVEEPSALEPSAPEEVASPAAVENPWAVETVDEVAAPENDVPVQQPAPEPEVDVVAPDVAPPIQPSFEAGASQGESQWDSGPAAAPMEPQPSSGIDSLWAEADSAFEAAEKNLEAEDQRAAATGDSQPMLAAHDSSPFEEGAVDYTASAFELEAPAGMSIEPAPFAAEVASEPLSKAKEAVEREPETAEVFEPAGQAGASSGGDYVNTMTMADLYTRQGLVADARQIYENILSRDPGNESVRARLAALGGAESPSRDPRIERLGSWLARVSRREVSRVQ